jgi:hypothetical protein
MNLASLWRQHLKENKMTYTQHLLFAMSYGLLCVVAGCCLIIHSLLPCFLQRTGSRLIEKLNQAFKKS